MVAPDLTLVPSASRTCSELVPTYVTVSVALARVPATPADAPGLIAQTHSDTARNATTPGRFGFNLFTTSDRTRPRKGEGPLPSPPPSCIAMLVLLDQPCG